MLQIVTSVVISLLLMIILLRAYEVRMQQRFLDVYEKLLRISQIIGETDISKSSSESRDSAKSRN